MITIGYGRYFMSHGVTKAIFLRKKSTGMNLPPMLLENMMKILLQPVYKFDFNNRVLFGLCAVDIRTLKDLLVEIKVFKMYHLRCFRGFGTKSFENVYDVLHQNDILDENNDSYLFEFI